MLNQPATLKLNPTMNRLELLFPQAPASDIDSELRKTGFRWKSKKTVWFAKESVKAKALADKLTVAPATEAIIVTEADAVAVPKKRGRPAKAKAEPMPKDNSWYKVRTLPSEGKSKITRPTKQVDKALGAFDELLLSEAPGTVIELLKDGVVSHTQTVQAE